MTVNRYRAGVLLIALAAAACGEKKAPASTEETRPADAVPEAPKAEPKAEPEAAPSGSLALSPENSKIEFTGAKVVGSHDGAFERFSGSVAYKNGDPVSAEIQVEIDLDSVKTDSEKLDGHLKSPDFFDVAKFPKATFASDKVTAGGEGASTHTVSGNLTLHGVTKPVSFPAKIDLAGGKVAVSAEFTIDRKEFGIVYPGMPDNLIKDEVSIKLSVNSPL